jgi:epoxyqueuosine reductase
MADGKERLNRRDFFRMTGLAGVGASATLAATNLPSNPPAAGKHRLTDPAGREPRPWWVHTVDQPTIEIHWDQMQRYNEQMGTVRGPGFAKYVGQAEVDRLNSLQTKNQKQHILDKVPGFTLADWAIYNANMSGIRITPRSFLGPQEAPTPDDLGVPKWTGTPDEAARMLRVALRHFGVAQVGFVEMNENTRKLIYGVDPDGKQMVFEDVDQAYETDTKRGIPNKAKWAIVYTVQMSMETLKRAPTATGAQTTLLSYSRACAIQNQIQEFLRTLGYQGIGEASVNALGIAPAFGVMAGLGELSRLNRLITPEYGPMVRVFKMLTDLPVTTDKPIDAGIMEFCKSCKKCAAACPSGALSFDTEPTWQTCGGWNNPGHRAYFEDSVKCLTYWREGPGTNCGICFAVCPFSKSDKAWVHSWVKGTYLPFRSLTGPCERWTTFLATASRRILPNGGILICRNTVLTRHGHKRSE